MALVSAAKVTLAELNSEHNVSKAVFQVQIFVLTIGWGLNDEILRLLNERDRANRREQALREVCLAQRLEIRGKDQRLETQTQISVALAAILVVLLLSPHMGLLPSISLLLPLGCLAGACWVYAPRLLRLARGMKLPMDDRMRAVVLNVPEYFGKRIDRLMSRVRARRAGRVIRSRGASHFRR
jgi:hypothetical protein